MLRIMHRVNTIDQLIKTPLELGVEVDIRSQNKELIIHHEPFQKGESFSKWVSFFKHKILILNVKEEGLETRLLKLMTQYSIKNFFFLDQSFPFLRKTVFMGENRCAIRVSEYENIETVLALTGKVEWVWVDCFTHFPLNLQQSNILQKNGFKLCFVSPELQGRSELLHIKKFRKNIESLGIIGDAVCTKHPELWA